MSSFEIGDLVKRIGWGAYQDLYNRENHLGVIIDNLNGHQLCEVFWFKEGKKLLTNRLVVEKVSL